MHIHKPRYRSKSIAEINELTNQTYGNYSLSSKVQRRNLRATEACSGEPPITARIMTQCHAMIGRMNHST